MGELADPRKPKPNPKPVTEKWRTIQFISQNLQKYTTWDTGTSETGG